MTRALRVSILALVSTFALAPAAALPPPDAGLTTMVLLGAVDVTKTVDGTFTCSDVGWATLHLTGRDGGPGGIAVIDVRSSCGDTGGVYRAMEGGGMFGNWNLDRLIEDPECCTNSYGTLYKVMGGGGGYYLDLVATHTDLSTGTFTRLDITGFMGGIEVP